MEVKFGLVSCDSHAQLDRDAFTKRMSKAKWGDAIPQVVTVEENGEQADHWAVAGRIQGGGVVNCPAAMPQKGYYPRHWEEVPRKVYDPSERLKALDEDGVDAEVLFPNGPVQGMSFHAQRYSFAGAAQHNGDGTLGTVTSDNASSVAIDAEFELACVRAYNDALAEWRQVSDRYIPIAILPYLSSIETIVKEVEHAVKQGHGGITMFAEPALASKGLPHSNDAFWEPLWSACEDLDVPIHWHGSAGLPLYVLPHWKGYARNALHTATTSRLCATPTQAIPNLLLSGRMERHPRLKWVFAETGMGWINYVLEACDHEWEQRHLWTEGISTRPSDSFRRQIIVDFWFERGGVELRHKIGIDNIMWESDYPHITSTYPDSKKAVEEVASDLPEDERRKMLYGNAMRIYKLGPTEPARPVSKGVPQAAGSH